MNSTTVNNYHYSQHVQQHQQQVEEEEEYDDFGYSSPSSSAFESCSSVLTDDSTVVSCTSSIKEDALMEEYVSLNESQDLNCLLYPSLTIPFHESLSYNILKLYQVRTK